MKFVVLFDPNKKGPESLITFHYDESGPLMGTQQPDYKSLRVSLKDYAEVK